MRAKDAGGTTIDKPSPDMLVPLDRPETGRRFLLEARESLLAAGTPGPGSGS